MVFAFWILFCCFYFKLLFFFHSMNSVCKIYTCMRMLHLNILLFLGFFHRFLCVCRSQRIHAHSYIAKAFYSVQYLNSQRSNAVHPICFLVVLSPHPPSASFFYRWLFDLDNCFDPIICLKYTFECCVFCRFSSYFESNRMATLAMPMMAMSIHYLLCVCVCMCFFYFSLLINKLLPFIIIMLPDQRYRDLKNGTDNISMWLDIFCDPVMRQRHKCCFFPFFGLFSGFLKKTSKCTYVFVHFMRLKFCASFCVCACVCVIIFIFWAGTVISFLICPCIE